MINGQNFFDQPITKNIREYKNIRHKNIREHPKYF